MYTYIIHMILYMHTYIYIYIYTYTYILGGIDYHDYPGVGFRKLMVSLLFQTLGLRTFACIHLLRNNHGFNRDLAHNAMYLDMGSETLDLNSSESKIVRLTLGHLRYHSTDVPRQPNSPPDYVFRTDQPS